MEMTTRTKERRKKRAMRTGGKDKGWVWVMNGRVKLRWWTVFPYRCHSDSNSNSSMKNININMNININYHGGTTRKHTSSGSREAQPAWLRCSN